MFPKDQIIFKLFVFPQTRIAYFFYFCKNNCNGLFLGVSLSFVLVFLSEYLIIRLPSHLPTRSVRVATRRNASDSTLV